MAIFRSHNSQALFEGRMLVDPPSNIQVIMSWIVSYGLPRLTDPTPEVKPFNSARMENIRGLRHTPGIYIHPDKGTLVIRNMYKQVLHADYGDWVFRDVVNNNFFVVKQPALEKLYIPLGS